MLFLLFLSFSLSSIPYQYRDLVKEALKSAEIKTPKGLRENTKYPGVYEGDQYHFKLIKTLTNKHTNDVKGFSYNRKNCAIVKRKKFNLTDGFTVVDPQTQNIYLLTKKVYQEDKVIVYESRKVDIFHIMTDFVMETSTDQEINDLPIRSKRRASKRPKADIKFGYNWDETVDRPKLQALQENLEAGVGYTIKIGVSTKLRFKSIWDVSISFRLLFEGKFGVEVVIPDDSEIEIGEINLFSRKIAIPSLGFSIKFLGLEISIGAFMNFVLEIVDIKIEIPLGFDYFKGYKITTTKYFEITPSSTTDSKWETTITDLPERDSTKEVFKRIQKAKFSATVQIRPYLSLEFNVGALATSLECGLKFPVKFDFTFNKELCTFPHLHADVSMPIKMYFAFAGLDFGDYSIIDRAEKEILLINIILPSFCVGSKRMISDGGFDPSGNALLITMDDAYDVRSVPPVEKEVSVSFLDDDGYILLQKKIPFKAYDTAVKTPHDRFMVLLHYQATKIVWSLSYTDPNLNVYYSDDIYVKDFSDLKFDDKTNKLSYPIELKRSKNDNSDILKMTANIQQVPVTFPNEIYKRKTEWTMFYFYDLSVIDYSLISIDEEGNRRIDYASSVFSYYADTEDCIKTGDTFCNDLNDYVFLIAWTEILENNVKIRIDIYRINEVNGEIKFHPIAVIITPTLNYGDDFSQMPEGQEIYAQYIEDGFQFIFYYTVFSGNKVTEYGPYEFYNLRENFDSYQEYVAYQLTDTISITFQFLLPPTMFLIKTSYDKPYSDYETIISSIGAVDTNLIEVIYNIKYRFFTIFNEGETYKILKFSPIPEKFRNDYIYIVFDSRDYLIDFLDDRVTILGSGMGLIAINGSETLEIPIIRERYENMFINASYYYVMFPPSGLIVVPDGTAIHTRPDIVTLLLVPNFYNVTNFAYYSSDGYVRYSYYTENSYTIYTFSAMHDEGDDFILYLNSTGLGEEEPSVEADLTNYKDYIDVFGELIYSVFSNNGIKIRAEMDGKYEIVDLVDKKATFHFKGDATNIVFTSICANDTEKACEIKYPEPNQTGYHYIKYPNRWGISTTGRGFLAEIIPVEKGKSFFYYKTYTGSIEKVREYSAEPVDITIKIIDKRNANYENMKRTRTICLIDEDGLVVPFSRQFVNDDLFGFLEMIGVSQDIDMNYLYNDEEGKIIFDPKYISSNDFANVSSDVCDLNTSDTFVNKVDKSELIFDVGGLDREQMRNTIIFLAVAVLIILVVFGLLILCIVLKCRKCIRKRVENKYNYRSSDEEDLYNLYEREPEKMVVDAFGNIENNVFDNIGKNGHEELIVSAFEKVENNVFDNIGKNSHEQMIVEAFGKVEKKVCDKIGIHEPGQFVVDAFDKVGNKICDKIGIYDPGQVVVDAFEKVEKKVFDNIGINEPGNMAADAFRNIEKEEYVNPENDYSENIENNESENMRNNEAENIENNEAENIEKEESKNIGNEEPENIENNEYVNPEKEEYANTEKDDSASIEKDDSEKIEKDDSVSIEKDDSEKIEKDEYVNPEKDEYPNTEKDDSASIEKDESEYSYKSITIEDSESEYSSKYDNV